MNLKWKVSRVSVSIAGRSSTSTRSWNQYLCTTTVVIGWTQDEHFLEDDLLLDFWVWKLYYKDGTPDGVLGWGVHR